jgi:hypothetical protein
MAISRVRIWVAFEILTAAAQNAEFQNIIDFINNVLLPDGVSQGSRLDVLEAKFPVTIASGGTGQITASAAFTALKQAATDAATGVAELATLAEVNAGTDTTRIVVPDTLAGSVYGTKTVVLKVITEATALTAGDGKMYFTVPIELGGMDLVTVGAHVYTVSSSGLPTIQIHNLTQAADMLTTRITIDVSEKDSSTAAAAAVIDTANDDVATGDEIRIDVDVAGTGTLGLEVRMGFRTP